METALVKETSFLHSIADSALLKILSSDFSTTVITVLFGGFILSFLTRQWQKQKYLHDMQIDIYRQLMDVYHDLILYLHCENVTKEIKDNWRTKHADFLAINQMCELFFSNSSIYLSWRKIADKIGNYLDCIEKNGKDRSLSKLKNDIYSDVRSVKLLMAEAIQGGKMPCKQIKSQN